MSERHLYAKTPFINVVALFEGILCNLAKFGALVPHTRQCGFKLLHFRQRFISSG